MGGGVCEEQAPPLLPSLALSATYLIGYTSIIELKGKNVGKVHKIEVIWFYSYKYKKVQLINPLSEPFPPSLLVLFCY